VAKLLDLSVERIRGYVRSGFLEPVRGPRGEIVFNFQDLVLLRTAKELVGARIAPRRVKRALQELRRQLPADRPLSGLSIVADGRRIVVRDGRTRWNPESGQTLFDFEVSDLVRKVAPLAERMALRGREKHELDADGWYEVACDLEAMTPDEALEAYRRAIELDPAHADAHVNLGRLLHESGQVESAAEHYRRALDARANDPTAAFNLGVALEDLGRDDDAIEAYERAIAADRNFGDAHYNLAALYDRLGKPAAAIRHLRIYRQLTRGR
jgi:tetratricopeptide (TPR) repeat protein